MTDLHRYTTSLAYTDTRGDGACGREWLFGVPYDGESGALQPWCMHCGHPMVAPCSPGETHPYIDLAAGESEPPCKNTDGHVPVYIWTPRDGWYEVPHIDLDSLNHSAALHGSPPIGPFDAAALDEAEQQHQRHHRNRAEEAQRQEQQAAYYRTLYRRLNARAPLSAPEAYRLLHALAEATPHEGRSLRALHRTAAMRWHPDRDGGDAEIFKLASEAYRIVDLCTRRTDATVPPPHPDAQSKRHR